jgi:hypothetical protein
MMDDGTDKRNGNGMLVPTIEQKNQKKTPKKV